MKSKIAFILMAVAIAFRPSSAQPQTQSVDDAIQTEASNFSHENTLCAVYSNIAAQCLENKDKSDPAVPQFRYAAKNFLLRSMAAGTSAGMSDKAMIARVEVARQQMREAIEDKCVNISVLYQQYGKSCKTLYEDGPTAFTEKIEKFLKR